MSLNDIRRIYEYADWANERMLAAIAALSEEQYTRTIVSSFSSIRDTLAHIAGADWLWLQRFNGTSPTAPAAWVANASLATLAENMRRTAEQRRAFIGGLTEERLGEELAYNNLKGDPFSNRLSDILFHVSNHASYHRGQLATMMRQIGVAPPSTDLIVFARERGVNMANADQGNKFGLRS